MKAIVDLFYTASIKRWMCAGQIFVREWMNKNDRERERERARGEHCWEHTCLQRDVFLRCFQWAFLNGVTLMSRCSFQSSWHELATFVSGWKCASHDRLPYTIYLLPFSSFSAEICNSLFIHIYICRNSQMLETRTVQYKTNKISKSWN